MCISYQRIKRGDSFIDVPCCKCYECRNKYANNWAFRLNEEWKHSSNAYFITLTYTEENYKNYFEYKDVQDFFKRLRKKNKGKIKYFVVGERGDLFNRVHYHAIIYNLDRTQYIQNTWDYGLTDCEELKGGAIRYVLKYLSKSKDEDGVTSIVRMSKGLGKAWLTPKKIKWLRQKVPLTVNKQSIPQYYRKLAVGNSRYAKDLLIYKVRKLIDKRLDYQDIMFQQNEQKRFQEAMKTSKIKR